jgi:hypothetical protein
MVFFEELKNFITVRYKMKSILVLLSFVAFQAQAGTISCLLLDGSVITGQIDGEVNITNLKMLDVENNLTIELTAGDASFSKDKLDKLAFSGKRDGENFQRVIKDSALNQFSKAIYTEDSKAPLSEPARCLIRWEPGI